MFLPDLLDSIGDAKHPNYSDLLPSRQVQPSILMFGITYNKVLFVRILPAQVTVVKHILQGCNAVSVRFNGTTVGLLLPLSQHYN